MNKLKKKLIISTVTFSMLLCTGITFKASESNTDMIYTSIPNQKNKYYQKIHNDLINYNNDLFENSAPNEFSSISNEEQKFPTSKFNYDDIWIRDVAPIITTKMVKFSYKPNYLSKATGSYLNNSFTKWLNENNFKFDKSDLVLDGGNVQWNNAQTIVVTDQILKDNPKLSKNQIKAELKNKLNMVNSIIVSNGK